MNNRVPRERRPTAKRIAQLQDIHARNNRHRPSEMLTQHANQQHRQELILNEQTQGDAPDIDPIQTTRFANNEIQDREGQHSPINGLQHAHTGMQIAPNVLAQRPVVNIFLTGRRRTQRLIAHTPIAFFNMNTFQEASVASLSIGRMQNRCEHCNALYWVQERTQAGNYTRCCNNGVTKLDPIPYPTTLIADLIGGETHNAKLLKNHFKAFNSCLAMASSIMDEVHLDGRGPPIFKFHGEIVHKIGNLLPAEGATPMFCQHYFIYDAENYTANRALNSGLNFEEANSMVNQLHRDLLNNNPYIACFKSALETAKRYAVRSMQNLSGFSLIINPRERPPSEHYRTYNAPNCAEIALIMPGDNSTVNANKPQEFVIHVKGNNNNLKFISRNSPVYDPLHYVLFHSRGGTGWTHTLKNLNNSTMTISQYYRYRLQCRDAPALKRPIDDILHYGGKLFQAYVCDQYAKMEDARLNYIRNHQTNIRADLYQNIRTGIANGQENIGRNIILPTSVVGSPRYMSAMYQDAIAITRKLGKPSLFLTFTANGRWPEVLMELHPGQSAVDRPDIVARVFHIKLKELLNDLLVNNVFGQVIGYIYVVEFQKRGLPHAHILLILDNDDRPKEPAQYDNIVCAEIPDPITHPKLYGLVTDLMMHGPCGNRNRSCSCMQVRNKCVHKFPKPHCNETTEVANSFPQYRRRQVADGGREVLGPDGLPMGNEWVVPYSPFLLLKYGAHNNLEVCGSIASIKYIFKYVHKGHDKAMVTIQPEGGEPQFVDEIQDYIDARYVASVEACWRLFEYEITERKPAVERLVVHLEDNQTVLFHAGNEQYDLDNSIHTSLTAFFNTVRHEQTHPPTTLIEFPWARDLTYIDMPLYYTYTNKAEKWERRKRYVPAVGRCHVVSPKDPERYYLRMLLTHVQGPTSFGYLKTYNGNIYATYKDSCMARKLIETETEWIQCMNEAKEYCTPSQLRQLLVLILLHNEPSNSIALWNDFKNDLSEDFTHLRRQNSHRNADIVNNSRDWNDALLDIQARLSKADRLLEHYQLPTPILQRQERNIDNIIVEQMIEDTDALALSLQDKISGLNTDQKSFYDAVVIAFLAKRPAFFFLDAPGGTGKTFVFNLIADTVRSTNSICLSTASSGIAGLLLNLGTTAHTRFKIPINAERHSCCNVTRNTADGRLLMRTSVIIWDEGPMSHKFSFEALDRSLKDLMGNDHPFGGKLFITGGDFRQCLPITRKANRSTIVRSTIKRSSLWRFVEKFALTINERVNRRMRENPLQAQNYLDYASFLQNMGDGTLPHIHPFENTIEIPGTYLIRDQELNSLANWTFPDLLANYNDREYMSNRAILCPKNDEVDYVNAKILSVLPAEEKIYYSADSVGSDDNPANFPVEFLNSQTCNGMPPHSLRLKVGVPIILLRNLDKSNGLCNGTRLLVTEMRDNFIKAQIMNGNEANIGNIVAIPRILFTSDDGVYPFQLRRKQYPIRLAFAMTINKSQGQTFRRVGLYLPNPVFSHGQLYVAFSRTGDPDDIKCLILNTSAQGYILNNRDTCITKNIVYTEVLNDL